MPYPATVWHMNFNKKFVVGKAIGTIMNFNYENQGSSSFLTYKLKENDVLDAFNYGMIANNKINNIIPSIFSQINEDKFLKYNVSAKVSLSQYFEGFVNKKQVVSVFKSIASAVMDSEEYMIDSSMFVLDPNYIFVDVSTAQAYIICFPIVGKQSNSGLYDFYKNLIFTTSYDQTEDTDYVAKIISFLNSNGNFSVSEFKKMLTSLDGTQVLRHATPTPVAAPQPTDKAEKALKQPIIKKQQAAPLFSQPPLQKPEPQLKTVPQPPQNNSGNAPIKGQFEITSDANVSPQAKPNKTNKNDNEKKMSFMYLLNHFSKENLEIYKSQKEENASVSQTPVQHNKKDKHGKKKNSNVSAGNPVAGFQIPGQNQASPIQPNVARSTQPAEPIQPVNSTVQAVPRTVSQPIVQQSQPIVQTAPPVAAQSVQSSSQGFGETSVLGATASTGTTVLGTSGDINKAPATNPRLIRSKTMENIPINKPVFRLGTERSYVDYFVTDNSAISRSHANIIIRDDKYYIVDTNSTNHTYVNGNMIQNNVEYEINDKDMIKLANEDFEFRVF